MSHDRLTPSSVTTTESVSKQIIKAAVKGPNGVAELGKIKDTAATQMRIGELDERVARGLIVQANQGLGVIAENS